MTQDSRWNNTSTTIPGSNRVSKAMQLSTKQSPVSVLENLIQRIGLGQIPQLPISCRTTLLSILVSIRRSPIITKRLKLWAAILQMCNSTRKT